MQKHTLLSYIILHKKYNFCSLGRKLSDFDFYMHRVMVEMTSMNGLNFDQWGFSVFYVISFSISSCLYSGFYRFTMEFLYLKKRKNGKGGHNLNS